VETAAGGRHGDADARRVRGLARRRQSCSAEPHAKLTLTHQRFQVLLLARELHVGGSERQLCEMVRSLDRRRCSVHAGCFRTGGTRAREIEAEVFPLVQFPLRSFRAPSNVWSAVRALRSYVRTRDIAVIHAFDPPTSLFVGVAAPFLRRSVVLTSQRSF